MKVVEKHSELIMSTFSYIFLGRKDGNRRNSVENEDGGHITDSGFSLFALFIPATNLDQVLFAHDRRELLQVPP